MDDIDAWLTVQCSLKMCIRAEVVLLMALLLACPCPCLSARAPLTSPPLLSSLFSFLPLSSLSCPLNTPLFYSLFSFLSSSPFQFFLLCSLLSSPFLFFLSSLLLSPPLSSSPLLSPPLSSLLSASPSSTCQAIFVCGSGTAPWLYHAG